MVNDVKNMEALHLRWNEYLLTTHFKRIMTQL